VRLLAQSQELLLTSIMGGVPTVAGAALFWDGWSMWGSERSGMHSTKAVLRTPKYLSGSIIAIRRDPERLIERVSGDFLVASGLLSIGFGALCTVEFLRAPRDAFYGERLILETIIGVFPTVLGAAAVFGRSLRLCATTGRESRSMKWRSVAFSVARIGVGGLVVWLSGLVLRGAVLPNRHEGLTAEKGTELWITIALSISVVAIGCWFIVTGSRSILSANDERVSR
jgi:hypothetical protein